MPSFGKAWGQSSPWLWGGVALIPHLLMSLQIRKQRPDRKQDQAVIPIPTVLLSPIKLHFFHVLNLPKGPPKGTKYSNIWIHGDISHSNHENSSMNTATIWILCYNFNLKFHVCERVISFLCMVAKASLLSQWPQEKHPCGFSVLCMLYYSLRKCDIVALGY